MDDALYEYRFRKACERAGSRVGKSWPYRDADGRRVPPVIKFGPLTSEMHPIQRADLLASLTDASRGEVFDPRHHVWYEPADDRELPRVASAVVAAALWCMP